MKKIFTLLWIVALSLNFVNAQKKVAYVTIDKDMDANAYSVGNDVVIQMLKEDPNIDLTILVCDEDGNIGRIPIDLDDYDVIIAQEGFGSGNNIWKEGYPLHLGSLPVPTIYNKIYSLRSGRALTTGNGETFDAMGILELAVDEPEHDIFRNIDVSSGSIKVFKSGVTDLGASGEKCLQYNTGNIVSGGTKLGHPSGIDNAELSLNYFAPGSTIDEVTVPVRVLNFNMNLGQVVSKGDDGTGTNLTEDCLQLWKNAVYILAGIDGYTSVSTPTVDKIEAYAVQGGIRVPANLNVSVYSISGQLIKAEVNTDFVAANPGIYVVTTGNSVVKVAVR